LTAIGYFIVGLLFCITIIGIPFGVQLMKFAAFALSPFGKNPEFPKGNMGCLTLGFNILWIVFGWWEIAIMHFIFGCLFCITIVGIPFGVQHFKLAKLSLLPFGSSIK